MPILPDLRTESAVDAWVEDATAVQAALVELGRHLGLRGPPERYERGSVPVAAFGDRVVKLFPPEEGRHAATELAALQALHRALPVRTPAPYEPVRVDGWTVLVMERLDGHELANVWETLSPAVQVELGAEVGRALRVMHELPAPPEIPRVDWASWVAERTKTAVIRQRARGCPNDLLMQIPEFLSTADLSPGPIGWLHTEVMLEHLLADPHGSTWRLSGLIDFEPSWVGPVDYELSSIGLFVARGDRRVFHAVLEGLGRPIEPDLPRRVLGMALMHRYCNLGWYLRRLGRPHPGASLLDLAAHWFG